MDSLMNVSERKVIDLLVNEFWRLGYFTLSRRYGTYLPEPSELGKFKVDVIGRQKDKYAVGIILNPVELNNPDLIEKISYLASRQSRTTKKSVMLLIGVPIEYYKAFRLKINHLKDDLKKNIKLIKITENERQDLFKKNKLSKILFS